MEKSTIQEIKDEINKLTSNTKGMNPKELKEWKLKLNKLFNSYNNITGEEYYTLFKI